MSRLSLFPALPRRRLSPLLASMSACLVVSVAACGKQAPADSAPAPADVKVLTVSPRDVQIVDEFNGRVEAVHTVDVRPRVSGYLEKLQFTEGSRVKQGAVLFVIDPRPYRIALERMRAQRQRAQATADLAAVQLMRVQTLIASRATSQEELDIARASDAQAKADLRAAEAAVQDAQLNLDFTQVRAPISGMVSRALLTAGNLATADQTLLTTVVAQDPIYVYFDFDEQSYLRYNAQRSANASQALQANAVRVALVNEPDYPHAGTVDFQDTRINPATGTIRARVRLSNAGRVFIPGAYARVKLAGTRPERVLLIEERAVLTDQDRKYVYVVDNGKALRREVQLGRLVDGQRVIVAGLQDGDRVVVEGTQKIFYPGAPVNAVAATPASSAAAGPAVPVL